MKYCGTAKIIGSVTNIATIAVNHSIRVLDYLNKRYGRGRWRKLKGEATVELKDGRIKRAEIHWYSAHGIGNVECKVKFFFD